MYCSGVSAILLLSAVLTVHSQRRDSKMSQENQREITAESQALLAKFEPYQSSKSEIVFLVDNSGSIGAPNFHFEIDFIRHVSTIFSISEDEVRVAVVTYSDSNKIIRHIDYIGDPVGKNKCSLLGDLSDILFTGGWTDTKGALIEAQNILQQARPTVQRLIVLLTDGESNKGDPIPVARNIRNSGIEIIAVGVGNINENELNAIATIPNVFILDTLSEIEKLAQRIKNDVRETTWDLSVGESSCNTLCTEGYDCCDDLATCSCGTRSGKHQCACQPGYTGSGYRGHCEVCPRGTYKSSYGYLDCTACPLNANTFDVGSTAITQCHCKPGYIGQPGQNCTVVRCPALSAPPGGYVFDCQNTYGDSCKFKCDERLYRPTPGGSRQRNCLEDGRWSGNPFTCTKITCDALSTPTNGDKVCDNADNSIGSTCTFTCNRGYDLKGSSHLTCELDGGIENWSGEEPMCKPRTCPPLDGKKHMKIKPPACETSSMPFRSVCVYRCEDGYELHGTDTRECLATGEWSDDDTPRICKDTEPPKLRNCPGDIVRTTDLHKATARISWNPPKATDNTGVEPTVTTFPRKIKPPHWFQVGDTEVTYIAMDDEDLVSTCRFTVTVKDQEPPQVIFCPNDLEIKSATRIVNVTWNEPRFLDNVDRPEDLTIHVNRHSGSDFYWGEPSPINYKVRDTSGNVAYCNFTVNVKQHACPYESAPENGALSCETWLGGQFCGVSCHDKYEFVFEPEQIYYCRQDPITQTGEWRPAPLAPRFGKEFQFPWPDCARLTEPSKLQVGLAVQYYVNSCFTETGNQNIRENFIAQFQEFGRGFSHICGPECKIENVDVYCGPAPIANGNVINKRDVSRNIIRVSATATVEAEPSVVQPDLDEDSISSVASDSEDEELDNLLTPSEKISRLLTEMQMNVATGIYREIITNNGINTIPSSEPEFVQETEIQAECPLGHIVLNSTCLACPKGTHHDTVLDTCEICPIGWYQDSESNESCIQCPDGTTTKLTRSKSLSDCRGFCTPGTFSTTGLETCTSCPRGTYQPNNASTSCLPCEGGLTTWAEGAVSEDFCKVGCVMGSYSDTGYMPCEPCPRGSYQPLALQTSCIQCGDGLTTHYEGAHLIQYCQAVDNCELFPCLNNATCTNTNDYRECHCPIGFGGESCGTNIDDCVEGLCKNGGICVDDTDGYHCNCSLGFTGTNCQVNIDECLSHPCLNGGSCHDRVNSYVCECRNGYTGEHCEVNYFDCASNPCQNGATCFDLAQNFTCCCPPGFAGRFCEEDFDECASSPCQNGGLCINGANIYMCECLDGFTGAKCEIDIDDCEANLCTNGATCHDLIGEYSCTCTMGYTGPYCGDVITTDFNMHFPSAQATDYAMMSNVPDLYEFTLSFWMRTTDTSSYGTPVSYAHSHGPGETLIDNALTLQDYNSFVLYINGEPVYTDLRANSDSNWHHVTVTWESSTGSWKFYFDNQVIREGSGLQHGKLISGGGTLVVGQEQDGVGGLFSAAESFVGDLTQVNLWDYAMTTGEVSSVYAGCNEMGNVIAWIQMKNSSQGNVLIQEESDLCTGKDNCGSAPCERGGICKDLVNDYECDCPVGYGGKQCTQVQEMCHLSFCQNGGSCNRNVDPHNCNCVPGFSGPYCEFETGTCLQNSCQNGGLCEIVHGMSICKCDKGFAGRKCQYDVNECRHNNGGCSHVCLNTHGSFVCQCPVGYALMPDSSTCHDISFCSYKDVLYSVEEVWEDNCLSCWCENGTDVCTDKQCPILTCPQGQHAYKGPGECCSSCIADSETCSVSLTGMYETFDWHAFQFRGRCRYVFAQDCSGGDFSIHVQEEKKRFGLNPLAHRKTLFIHIKCITVEIKYNGDVRVADVPVQLPYSHSYPSVVEITRDVTNSTFVKTSVGVIIEWNMLGDIKVSVPRSYKDMLCGLCGNMNNNNEDDETTRQFLPARTANEFIHSWKVDGYKYCRRPVRTPTKSLFKVIKIKKVDLCAGKTYADQREARSRCSVFKDRAFRACYPVVNPTTYYETCLEDVCTCSFNELCYCESVTAYVHECRRNGIIVRNWRDENLCATTCPEGMIYDHCGPPCPQTCDVSELQDPVCQNQPCVPKCQCPAGTVLHEGACILQRMCP
ncbi:sushi, von Willebrand factor type A, EGF and pentraxin domain-containing protein 1-like [Glandiceps talaboti]